MKLHVLGRSGPFPESGGATSGYLLEAGDTLLQFDLGSGVLARLTALTPPESLSALFLSHWHFDHTSDLPVLLYRLAQEKKSLNIYAPADDASVVRKIVAGSPEFILREVAPGDVLSVGSCTVRVGSARHPVPAVGYRVECGGRVFGYTGDTNTLPSLVSFYSGCDLLLADALFPAADWTEQKPHLSAALAAELAAAGGVDRLVLTHLNPGIPPEILLCEAQDRFPRVSLASCACVLDV